MDWSQKMARRVIQIKLVVLELGYRMALNILYNLNNLFIKFSVFLNDLQINLSKLSCFYAENKI